MLTLVDRSTRPPDRPSHPAIRHLAAAAVVLAALAWAYAPSLRGALLRGDDLYQVAFARAHGPLAGFGGEAFRSLWYARTFYRPLFTVQTWLFYQWFGVNHTGYQLSILIVHAVAALMLYVGAFRISRSALFAAAAAVLFAAHPYVSPLIVWVSDSGVFTNLIAVGVVLLLLRGPGGVGWHIALSLLLFLAPLTRETGLALTGAVVGYALIAWWRGALTRQQGIAIVVEGVTAVALYFAIRTAAMGAPARVEYTQPSALGARLLSAAEVAALPTGGRLGLYAYTAFINGLAVFFPVFGPMGLVEFQAVALTLAGVVAFGLLAVLLLNWARWPSSARVGLPAVAAAVLGAALLAILARVVPLLGALRAWLAALLPGGVALADRAYAWLFAQGPQIVLGVAPAMLTAGIVWAAARAGRWPREQRLLALFALGLIAANGIIAFAYFRPRSLSLSVVGWVVLLAVVFRQMSHTEGEKVLRWGVAALVAVLAGAYALRLRSSLPEWDLLVQNYTESRLCDDLQLDEGLVYEVAAYYDIPAGDVQACRAAQLGRP